VTEHRETISASSYHREAGALGRVVRARQDGLISTAALPGFRQTLVTTMRAGVHPVVVSAVVGHKRVELAPEVYDRADTSDLRQGLGVVVRHLLPNLLPTG